MFVGVVYSCHSNICRLKFQEILIGIEKDPSRNLEKSILLSDALSELPEVNILFVYE